MSHYQTTRNTVVFRSRDWVFNQATEQELLNYLQHLLLVHRAQQRELTTLAEVMVEDHVAMQGEMERATMDEWLADQTPPRISWLALGLAGLAGYLIGGRRD